MVADQRQRLIRLIHVGKRDLALDDDTYRSVLVRVGGASSSAKMSVPALERVLAHFKKTGFKVRAAGRIGGAGRRLDQSPTASKLRAVWLDLASLGIIRDASEAALAAWVRREAGVDAIDWLSSDEMSSCIEKLKKWLDRIIAARRKALLAALGIPAPRAPDQVFHARAAIEAAALRVLGRRVDVTGMHETEYRTLLQSIATPT